MKTLEALDIYIKKFLEDFGTIISGQEDDAIFDLMCDDHKILVYDDVEYWIKPDNSMFEPEDELIYDVLFEINNINLP